MQRLLGEELRNTELLLIRRMMSELRLFTDTELQLSGPNLFILRMLYECRGTDVFQKDIEQFMSVTKSTCSKVLSTMEAKGLITRESADDARYKKIVITQKGIDYITAIHEKMLEIESTIIQDIPKEDIDALFRCLDSLKETLSKNR